MTFAGKRMRLDDLSGALFELDSVWKAMNRFA